MNKDKICVRLSRDELEMLRFACWSRYWEEAPTRDTREWEALSNKLQNYIWAIGKDPEEILDKAYKADRAVMFHDTMVFNDYIGRK